MKILISEDKNSWSQFLVENDGSFLQSWDWGKFQQKQKKKIWRLQIKSNNGEIISEAQIQKEVFPFGKNMLYISYGPCFKSNLFLKDKKKILNLILKEARKIAKKEKAVFLKIEATSALPKMEEALRSQRRIQPKKNLVLLINKPEEDLLKSFHPKTRYNIRLAEKKGVQVLILKSKEDKIKYLKFFLKILHKTSKREKFKPYFKYYYKDLLSLDNTILYLAEYKNKFIVANVMLYFRKRAIYVHGASDYKYRKIMAPHFLHWRQICDAKNMGYEEYDFGGIDEQKWPGVTRFKMGFNGEVIEFPQGKDFAFQRLWYKIYKIARKIF